MMWSTARTVWKKVKNRWTEEEEHCPAVLSIASLTSILLLAFCPCGFIQQMAINERRGTTLIWKLCWQTETKKGKKESSCQVIGKSEQSQTLTIYSTILGNYMYLKKICSRGGLMWSSSSASSTDLIWVFGFEQQEVDGFWFFPRSSCFSLIVFFLSASSSRKHQQLLLLLVITSTCRSSSDVESVFFEFLLEKADCARCPRSSWACCSTSLVRRSWKYQITLFLAFLSSSWSWCWPIKMMIGCGLL